MNPNWPQDAAAARAYQEEHAARVETVDRPVHAAGPRRIAGADLSAGKDSPDVHCAVVSLHAATLAVAEVATSPFTVTFPYIPGLLAFREVPPIAATWALLEQKPDLLIVDGNGRAHPRRFGAACHLGLVLDVPTIGCAKTPHIGEPAGDLGPEAGATVPIVDQGEVVAMALRTRAGSAPVYISIGHRVSLESAVAHMKLLMRGTRVPEPTRQAHIWANKARRGEL